MKTRHRLPASLAVLILENGLKPAEVTDRILDALNLLKYEGKTRLGPNLKAAQRALKLLEGLLVRHIRCEDAVVFPYFERHVPRLYVLIGVLKNEHSELRMGMDLFRERLLRLPLLRKPAERSNLVEAIKETGQYLVYLLRHHVHAEKESIFRFYSKELKPSERKELEKMVRVFK